VTNWEMNLPSKRNSSRRLFESNNIHGTYLAEAFKQNDANESKEGNDYSYVK